MNQDFQDALSAGAERVAAWSDLLDAINVFPVADGDTGRNLVISLSPLRQPETDPERLTRRLLLAARGNSGNIAARFLSGLLTADSQAALAGAIHSGRARAWQAVHRPVPGTMLGVFDALAAFVGQQRAAGEADFVAPLIDRLEEAVRSTHELLPRLQQAGVVDSGALGMFLFLEGFFRRLFPGGNGFREISAAFRNRLKVAPSFKEHDHPRYCVDTVIRCDGDVDAISLGLGGIGDDTVVMPHRDLVKVHLHTEDREAARRALESFGRVVQWSDDDIARQVEARRRAGAGRQIHVMTDAAGSVTRKDARRLGMTLLNSYITIGETSLPETLVSPRSLYRAMAGGTGASTSQASSYERHQHYRRVLDQFERALYLCVGSAYTGNYDTVMEWKRAHDPGDRLTVIDTGAASGRLGAVAMAVAERAAAGESAPQVIGYARRAVSECRELIFLERLKYLAAGGRLSKSRAALGDMLHFKPVVSPTAEGVKKLGTVKNRAGQLAFALKELDAIPGIDRGPLILLEYTDNREWVETEILPALRDRWPAAELRTRPLSLTTGVHTGPGTWAVAVLPGWKAGD